MWSDLLTSNWLSSSPTVPEMAKTQKEQHIINLSINGGCPPLCYNVKEVKNHSDELIFHSQSLRRSAANLERSQVDSGEIMN